MKFEQIRTIRDLRDYITNSGSYFFSRSNIIFFNSETEDVIKKVDDRIYFITSERFEESIQYPRKWTIRYIEEPIDQNKIIDVKEYSKFQEYSSYNQAAMELEAIN